MNPINFHCCLTLYLNTWCISVEEEVGNINMPNLRVIRLYMDRNTFDALNIPKLFSGTVTRSAHSTNPSPNPSPMSSPGPLFKHY